MDTWTRGGGGGGGRGRGRGRGRGDYNNNNNNNRQNYYNDNNSSNGSNVPITARLGPMANNNNQQYNNNNQQYNNSNQQYNNNNQQYNNNNSNNSQQYGRGGGGSGHYTDHSPRGGRNQPFSSRGRGGGRGGGGRGRFTREFIDEDIDMGREIPPNAPVIMVSGHPPGSQKDLLNFLHRKSKMDWEELSVKNEGNVTYITVDSQETADILIRKNNFSFMGSTLSIRLADGNGNAINSRLSNNNNNNNNNPRNNQPRSSNALSEFLQERWDPQQGFLNMDDLPPTSHSITVVLSRLLGEAHKIFGNSVITISFARNKLWSVQPICKIATLFPNIKNLSLQENEISEFKRLDGLANNKLRQLAELVLSGNPIQTNTNPDLYMKEVAQRFPTLTQLDFQPIGGQPSINPSIPSTTGFGASTLPLPVKANFFDQDNSRQASQDLLSKFFPLFDSNRSALVDLYDQQAVFSINVSGSCFARNTWGQGQRLTIGNENIAKKFASFPPTIHDLTRAENFALDAWQVSGSSTHPVLLYLTVHGSFQEANGALSFDRVFIIAPSTPGSRAQNAGWQYIIICDSLILRNYSGNQAFQPTA